MKPMKNEHEINEIIENACKISQKYKVLLLLGIHTGLRVSDLLRLQVRTVKEKSFTITEKKTKKQRKLLLSDELFELIQDFISENDLSAKDFLIFSTKKNKDKPLSRVQAYRVVKAASLKADVEEIGTHSMRKTYAKEHFERFHDIQELQKLMNHKYMHTTLMYLFDIKDLNGLGGVKKENEPEGENEPKKENGFKLWVRKIKTKIGKFFRNQKH